jgi:hypothetical protein
MGNKRHKPEEIVTKLRQANKVSYASGSSQFLISTNFSEVVKSTLDYKSASKIGAKVGAIWQYKIIEPFSQ